MLCTYKCTNLQKSIFVWITIKLTEKLFLCWISYFIFQTTTMAASLQPSAKFSSPMRPGPCHPTVVGPGVSPSKQVTLLLLLNKKNLYHSLDIYQLLAYWTNQPQNLIITFLQCSISVNLIVKHLDKIQGKPVVIASKRSH